jgi:hypothetical protein
MQKDEHQAADEGGNTGQRACQAGTPRVALQLGLGQIGAAAKTTSYLATKRAPSLSARSA